MITFRFKAVMFACILASCGSNKFDLPPVNTPIGRILRDGDFKKVSDRLKRYAEQRQGDIAGFEQELIAAGFVASRMGDERGRNCRTYYRQSHDMFPMVYLLRMCEGEVFAKTGQLAP